MKNTGTTRHSWTIEWDFPSGTSVTSAWDANVTSSGHPLDRQERRLERHPRPRRHRQLRLQRQPAPAPPRLQAQRRHPATAARVPGDNAPSAPGTPTASGVTDTSVKLSWSAATDDKGIKNYDVLRGGAKVATVTAPATPTPV